MKMGCRLNIYLILRLLNETRARVMAIIQNLYDYLGFGPAFEFKVVVQRSHAKYPFAVAHFKNNPPE